ncbi:uncharacterized protein LOC130786555 [Actinidia eriantha]|uniref:uncharacterized protein LOC130786555 n=1 Tax=Actinidia eriantha TaxID=165200 RepID=UPI002582F6B5|nr:uncharacterized protein LOC130786555 [Actinidia eriantha]XP_057502833.1 uncharacterized protein LOC130786555 [Actinidia eriantha]
MEAEKFAFLNEVADFKKKNEDLASEALAFVAEEGSLVSRVIELKDQLKVAQGKVVLKFKAGVTFQEEGNEAYLDGFIDAKVAAKVLFPDLDFFALKPVDDIVSQAIGEVQTTIVEEDNPQS